MVLVCFTCVLNCGFGCCEAENGHEFQFQRSGTEVDEGAVHGQPTHYFWGLLKTVPNCLLDRNVHVNFLEMNGLECVLKKIVNVWNLMC